MAKSARSSGKGGETHYNRKDRTGSEGRPAGDREGRDDRPARKPRTEGGGRPAPRKDGERAPYRKPSEDKPYARKRSEGGPDDRPDRKPFGDKKTFGSRDDRPAGPRPSGDRKPPRGRSDDRREDRPASGEKRAFGRRDDTGSDRPYQKPFEREGGDRTGDRKPFTPRGEKPAGKSRDEREERPAKRPYERRDDAAERRSKRPYEGRDGDRAERSDKPFARKSEGSDGRGKRPEERSAGGDKPFSRRPPSGDGKPYGRKSAPEKPVKKKGFEGEEFAEHSNPAKPGKWDTDAKAGPMTLNKYLAHSGVSSRRDAAAMIKEGKVEVNGKVLTEPGYRVQPADVITMDGKTMQPQRHFVYVLLNKPKDFLTTTEDDRGRRTVMELVSGATEDRLYPIGRLDRNTTGVLLMTNDGDLAQKLSHPKYESKKIYQVSLDKDLTKRDFDQIVEGVMLEDGMANVDRLAYLDKKSEIGLEIHSGRNRIVRRIFESLGYDVVKLDRVMYAGLTKKNVSRGKWRFLTEKEVITLKHFRN